MAAFSKISDIFELFEAILCELPFLQLFTIQRVNTAFRSMITSSPALRRTMLLENPSDGELRLQPIHREILSTCLSPFLLWHDTKHVILVVDLENIRWARRSGGSCLDPFSSLYPCERRQTWRGIKVGRIVIRLEESVFLLGTLLAGEETTIGDIADWAMNSTVMASRLRNERRWLHWKLLSGKADNLILDEESDAE